MRSRGESYGDVLNIPGAPAARIQSSHPPGVILQGLSVTLVGQGQGSSWCLHGGPESKTLLVINQPPTSEVKKKKPSVVQCDQFLINIEVFMLLTRRQRDSVLRRSWKRGCLGSLSFVRAAVLTQNRGINPVAPPHPQRGRRSERLAATQNKQSCHVATIEPATKDVSPRR